MRRCHCGCGQSLEGMRADAKWATASCSARASERRADDAPEHFAPDAFWQRVSRVKRPQSLTNV